MTDRLVRTLCLNPSLTDWKLNNAPIPSGSRFTPSFEFGTAKLTIKAASTADAGVYNCQASNALGTATTSGTIRVSSDDVVMSGTQHPSGESGLESISKIEEEKGSKSVSGKIQFGGDAADNVQMTGSAPKFVVPLDANTAVEGANLKLHCEVEPKKDDKLRVNWYHNGTPLEMGSRVKAQFEFGSSTLEISDLSARDRGVYTCKASNLLGEATTFTTVDCREDASGLDLTSKHPRGKEGMDALTKMEAKGQLPDAQEEEDEAGSPPKFVTEFKDISAAENATAYTEATLEPKKDPNLKTEWRLNGEAMQESNRLSAFTAFGMCVFELKSLRESDFGEYTCVATNKHGTAQSSFRLTQTGSVDVNVPRFTSQLKDVVDLVDGRSVHLECSYVPVNDPRLEVEWTVDGKPLFNSSRIKVVSDFGFAMLDISSADSKDSGTYTCTIRNKLVYPYNQQVARRIVHHKITYRFGQDTTSSQLRCEGSSGVFYEPLKTQALQKTDLNQMLKIGTPFVLWCGVLCAFTLKWCSSMRLVVAS